jgi:hypothetical protein
MAFAAKGPPHERVGDPLESSSYGGVDLQANIPNEAPAPVGHFIREVEVATGADVTARLERYAEIDPEFVRALGGDRFAPSLHCIDGGGP